MAINVVFALGCIVNYLERRCLNQRETSALLLNQ